METIVDQLNKLRDERYQKALHTYSELMLRFDQPQPGDAEKLDAAVKELNFDMHHVQNDQQLIERYRKYVAHDKEKAANKSAAGEPGNPNSTGCSADAESIRHTHRRLFIALDEKKQDAKRGEPSAQPA